MSTDKVYEQLKLAALEVKAILIDMDENIQPSVDEIEKLSQKVNDLNEQLAIYKYVKGQTELSPSFNLHLKVMEKTSEKENIIKAADFSTDKHESLEKNPEEKFRNHEFVQTVKKLELSLNDKFRIINELFKTSSTEYNLAVDQLNTITSFERSQAYLNELKHLYGWKDDHEMTIKLYQVNQKRF